jgi:hypothetical protein
MSKNVEEQIVAAFADVPAPDEGRLHDRSTEAAADCEPFQGKRWQEVPAEVLDRHQYALFWFTPEAYHYYLPAFLRAGLVAPDAVFVLSILQQLMPTDNEARARFRQARWGRLSPAQLAALQQWLQWLHEQAPPGGVFQEEISDALNVVLDRHWWRSG